MTRVRRRPVPSVDGHSELDEALAAMSAEELREVVQEVLHKLDDLSRARMVGTLVTRAARAGRGAPVSNQQVAEVLAFVKAAERVGQAYPPEVDAYLRLGSKAFARRDYAVAHRIFGALLPIIGEGAIDFGQHEMVEDVLEVDVFECAAQYVVAAYMTAAVAERAEAVRAAIDETQVVGGFLEPLRDMERVAVEPLPDLADFLPRWRARIAREAAGKRSGDWDAAQDGWLREVAQRLEGAAGLAKIARSTKRADDLRAWCACLVAAGNFHEALKAFEEAAELVGREGGARGELLDGAVFMAQQLGRKDLAARLERAWRASPSLARLCRWLGTTQATRASLRKRIAEALASCPKQATRQRALLHVLSHDIASAAKLLASAAGLGWSNDEHPGHLLFSMFARLLGGSGVSARGTELDGLDVMADPQAPQLATPDVDALLALAGLDGIAEPRARASALAAMKQAAEKRLAGVTAHKRRSRYAQAAELVATCVALDESSDAARWAAALQADYRRFPALRDAIDRAMTSARNGVLEQ